MMILQRSKHVGVYNFLHFQYFNIKYNYARRLIVIPNYNQQDATFLYLFISIDALHVSGGSSAQHQEHITVHTASGIVNQYCCWLVSWMRWNGVPSHPQHQQAAVLFDNTWSWMYGYVLLMLGGGTAWNM